MDGSLFEKKDGNNHPFQSCQNINMLPLLAISRTVLRCAYEDENIWLTQKMMATLYDVDVRKNTNYHIKKSFPVSSELQEDSVIRKISDNCC